MAAKTYEDLFSLIYSKRGQVGLEAGELVNAMLLSTDFHTNEAKLRELLKTSEKVGVHDSDDTGSAETYSFFAYALLLKLMIIKTTNRSLSARQLP